MPDENDGVVSFMGEQFRRLNTRFDTLGQRVDTLEGRMEDRLANIERRLSSQTQTEQAVIGHLASIRSSVDNPRVGIVGIERRLRMVEGR